MPDRRSRDPLFGLRSAVILLWAIMIAIIATGLSLAADKALPEAILNGLTFGGPSVIALHFIIGPPR